MSRRRIATPLVVCLALGVACGEKKERPQGTLADPPDGSAGSAGAAGDDGSAGKPAGAANGGSHSSAGGQGDPAHAGAGRVGVGGGLGPVGAGGSERGGAGGQNAPPSVCGNGTKETGEACDGDDLAGLVCADVGFEQGELSCSADCQLVTTECSGTEHCDDFRDNDGDRAIDCEDSDCEDVCGHPCDAPIALDGSGPVEGNTRGRPAALHATCGLVAALSGPQLVYELTAAQSGVLDVKLDSAADMTLSVRSECESQATELACSGSGSVLTEVEAGTAVYIVISGREQDQSGAFVLDAVTRTVTCGDGYRDAGEACDDGNTETGDGCSPDCEVESSESANNDSTQQADDYQAPYIGQISPQGDEDYVRIEVAEEPTALVAKTLDLGDGACSAGLLDGQLELLSEDGNSLALDDDGGTRFCDRLLVAGLTRGSYYLRVSASAYGATPTFPYLLSVDLDVCGNGRQSEAEGCDDGNLDPGDGCSEVCAQE